MPNAFCRAALNYQSQGLSVIPIEPRGKKSIVEWAEYQHVIADEKQINEWWRLWPTANIGLVTGALSGFVVVDIDSPDAGKVLREQIPQFNLKAVPRSKTGKGWQLFFKHPGIKVDNRTGVLPNLDVRGDGGYVVAPPSIHPSGSTYAWQVPLRSSSLPMMPEKLYQLVKAPPVAHEAIKDSIIWEGVPEGQRDTQIFKYACHLRAFACPEDVALDLVLAAAQRCHPPLNEFEARLKLKQAFKYPEGNKRLTPKALIGQAEFWPSLQSAKTIMEYVDTTRWLWDMAVPQGGVGMIAGQPRVGKSTLSLNLALAIARGAYFLGRPTVRNRVAYISIDNSVPEMKNIAAGIGLREFDDLLFHVGQIPDQATAWLFDIVTKGDIKFVVVDTFQRFLGIEEINDSAAVTRAMDPINHQVEKMGCSLLWVHHSGKSSNSTGALGSIAIKGMCPYYFELAREDGARILTSDLRGGRNFDGVHLKIDQATGWNFLAGTRTDALIERAGVKILELLTSQEGSLAEKEIMELVESRWQMTKRSIRILLRTGQIERTGKGGRSDPFRYTIAGELLPKRIPLKASGILNNYIRKSDPDEKYPIKKPTGENREQNQYVDLVPIGESEKTAMNPNGYSGSRFSGTRWEPDGNQMGTSSDFDEKMTGEMEKQKQLQDVIQVPEKREPDGNQMETKMRKEQQNQQVDLVPIGGDEKREQFQALDLVPAHFKAEKSLSKNERPVLCRNCYIPMVPDGHALVCQKCGLRHELLANG